MLDTLPFLFSFFPPVILHYEIGIIITHFTNKETESQWHLGPTIRLPDYRVRTYNTAILKERGFDCSGMGSKTEQEVPYEGELSTKICV